jgi:hypothetical protein
MSSAVQIFAAFDDFCRTRGLKPDDYRLIIAPLSSKADADFQICWRQEWEHIAMMEARGIASFNEGHIHGVPFKIESSL